MEVKLELDYIIKLEYWHVWTYFFSKQIHISGPNV